MNKNEELKFLREEITRLKLRVNELDSREEPTSAVCGHDVTLEHLRKLNEQHKMNGLCQLAGIDDKYGWYTTNIEPNKIKAFLNDANAVKQFLVIFCIDGLWEALEAVYHCQKHNASKEVIESLHRADLVVNGTLTDKGFMCYAVLGHLVFNMTKKLAVNKVIEIFQIVYEQTGINYGNRLPYTADEFLSMVKAHPRYTSLLEKNISDLDIYEYLRQSNI